MYLSLLLRFSQEVLLCHLALVDQAVVKDDHLLHHRVILSLEFCIVSSRRQHGTLGYLSNCCLGDLQESISILRLLLVGLLLTRI